MKHILIIAVCLVGASFAAGIPESSEERESGENGWYVPTKEGTFEWIDRETYEAQVKPEAEETVSQQQMGRIDLNAVDFHLFTRENEEKSQEITDSYKSISKSHFNASNPTKIIIHGWWQSDNADINEEIKAVWLKKSANNVIAVRWARAHGEYVLAVAALPEVGRKIANLVDYLVNQFNMSLGDLEVIGHSLGSHVAAYVAKQVKSGQIYKIVGLDPAMPLFSYDKTDNRLCSDDALYVETIQTNGGLLGFKHPIGKATFYPNGGKKQPGCFLDLAGMCSHARSVAYYVESVEKNNFPAVKCDTYKNALKKGCGSTYSSVRMNSHSNFVSASGQYYVPVNSKSPYGKGE